MHMVFFTSEGSHCLARQSVEIHRSAFQRFIGDLARDQKSILILCFTSNKLWRRRVESGSVESVKWVRFNRLAKGGMDSSEERTEEED